VSVGVLLVQLDGLLGVGERAARITRAHEEIARHVVLGVALPFGVRPGGSPARSRARKAADDERNRDDRAREAVGLSVVGERSHHPSYFGPFLTPPVEARVGLPNSTE
jgi:hypothetical protein